MSFPQPTKTRGKSRPSGLHIFRRASSKSHSRVSDVHSQFVPRMKMSDVHSQFLPRLESNTINEEPEPENKLPEPSQSLPSFSKETVNLQRKLRNHVELYKGRSYLEPLLPRIPQLNTCYTSPTSQRKVFQHEAVTDPDRGFGEIGFMRDKLGIVMPTKEETLQQFSLRRQHRGLKRTTGLPEHLKRINRKVESIRRLYHVSSSALFDEEEDDRQEDDRQEEVQEKVERKSSPRRRSKANSVKIGSNKAELTVYNETNPALEKCLQEARSRSQVNLNVFLRTLKPTLSAVKIPDRAVQPMGDGTVVTYTRKKLDSFYHLDRELLHQVKKKIEADRNRVGKQNVQNRFEFFERINTRKQSESGGRERNTIISESHDGTDVIYAIPRRNFSINLIEYN